MVASQHRRDLVIVCALLLVALVLRLWHLGSKSFWLDEGATWTFARQSLSGIVSHTEERNPPLYNILLHYWIRSAGTSEVAMRFPSVVFGVLAVALMGWIGNRLGGKPLAWITMGCMALTTFPLEYAQMARNYSFFLAASLASYRCLIGWEQSRQRAWAVGYVATTILMSYTHNYWVFNVIAQQLYIGWGIVRRRIPLWPWVKMSAAVGLGALPWLLVLTQQTIHTVRDGLWIPRPALRQLVTIPLRFVDYDVQPLVAWLCVLLVVVGFLKVRTSAQFPGVAIRWPLEAVDGLLLCWLACPVLLPFIVSRVTTPILWPRYTIAAAPALYLLIGRGIQRLPRPVIQRTVCGVLVVLAVTGLPAYYAKEVENWRSLTAMVEHLSQSGDSLNLYSSRPDVFYYYYRGSMPVHFHLSYALFGRQSMNEPEKIGLFHTEHGRIWLVIRNSYSRDFASIITSAVKQQDPTARLIYQQRFGGNLFLYGFSHPGVVSGCSESAKDGHA